MARYCSECGKEGGFLDFDIKYRKLPLSKERMLCLNCYDKIFPKENAEHQKIQRERNEENQNILWWKDRILRTFYEGTIKQLCHEQAIPIMQKRWTEAVSRRGTRYQRQYNYYYTYDELVSSLRAHVDLYTILDFAKKKNIPVRDVELEIDQYYRKKKQIANPIAPHVNDEVFLKILEKIDSFKPLLKNYPDEFAYQLDLGRYLLQYFPNATLEEQRSSARPDITIDDIAIEIKGPTLEIGLQSIADKCLRYPLYFEKGLIIVLFDIRITSRFLEDWKKGLQNKFPHVIVICK
jgi:hypothetical protein